jgi:hypothetical protein
VKDEVKDELEYEVNGGNKITRDKKCTIYMRWEYLELDCLEKKETITV